MALALAAMTLVTFVHVIMRYVFGGGLIWSLEATTYTFAWLVLIGMSYGVRTQSHIAVDLLHGRLPAHLRRWAGGIVVLLCLAYCGMMLYGSAVFVDRLVQLGNEARDIPLPRWLLTIIMPPAFALLGVRMLQAGWRAWSDETAASR
jgi:C4-dicarboxylate transporter DctQ subunit